MQNPIYLTDQELEAWHMRNFGTAIPYADDGAMREHCIELYHMATMPVVDED